MLWLSILDCSFSIFVISHGGYDATPLQAVRVPLLVGRSILHHGGRQILWGLLTHFTPPISIWPCLPRPSSVIGHIPLGVHYLPASTGIDVIPSALCTCSIQGLQPHHITCGLHLSSVEALVDVHGRSHNFSFSTPGKLYW